MITKLLTSIAIITAGLGFALIYFRRSPGGMTSSHPLAGHRPWRKVGAAICLLVSVMYVIGIYAVDIPERPVPYAIYWLIMIALLFWLFFLAVRDMMYTRKLMKAWREDVQQRRQAAFGGHSDKDTGNT